MFFFFQAEAEIRFSSVTGVKRCALPTPQPRRKHATLKRLRFVPFGLDPHAQRETRPCLCYNATAMGGPFLSAHFLVLLSAIFFFGATPVAAHLSPPSPRAGSANAHQQGIYLVFPFENAGASPRLDWIGQGLEELTIQRLSAAREQVHSHAGRVIEQERYGLPHTSKLSRATMLHVAEDLDADFVIFGRFTAQGKSLTIESRILQVSPARLLPALRGTGTLDSLMDLHAP